MTKTQAIAQVLADNGGTATWQEIYKNVEKYYPKIKDSAFWQEGIRGVVYREIRYNRTFKMESKGVVGLLDKQKKS
jgi:hypothetical protein